VVIKKRGNEVHLDVRAVIRGVTARQEAPRFGNLGTAGTLFAKQVTQTYGDVAEVVVGDVQFAVDQGTNIQMVLQVSAHAGKIMTDPDTHRVKMFGGPDA